MHKAGHGGVFLGVFVILRALDEGGCAVAYAYEGYTYFWQTLNLLVMKA